MHTRKTIVLYSSVSSSQTSLNPLSVVVVFFSSRYDGGACGSDSNYCVMRIETTQAEEPEETEERQSGQTGP